MTKKLIYCEACDKLATHSIKPEGGSITYWCTKHFNETVKELKSND